jgi:hypothetical protein
MSDDDQLYLSYLYTQSDSHSSLSLISASSVLKTLPTEFNEDRLIDLRSCSSLQISSNSISISHSKKSDSVIPNPIPEEHSLIEHAIKDISLNESCRSSLKRKLSEEITSAKNSIIEVKQEAHKRNIMHSSFAVPNKMYCSKCKCEGITQVSFRPCEKTIWQSLEAFCQTVRCCSTKAGRKKQELVHACRICQQVLVRISDE